MSLADNGNGTATLSGTPTQIGTFPITVTASNGVSPDASSSVILEVVALEVTTTSLPAATKKTAYGATLAAEGGASPYKWTLVKGSVLPPGLSLSSGGAISGKPTKVGTFSFNVKVTSTKTQSFPKDSAMATLSIVVGSDSENLAGFGFGRFCPNCVQTIGCQPVPACPNLSLASLLAAF